MISETVQIALITATPIMLTTLTTFVLQMRATKANKKELEAQTETLAKQDEKLAAVATKEAVEEVHQVVNSKSDKLAAKNDAHFTALREEIVRLNKPNGADTPSTAEQPQAPVTLDATIVRVKDEEP